MDEDRLTDHVRTRGGFSGRLEAARAVRGTLVALGERLRDDERAALARDLPASFARALERCAYAGDFDRDELFARVARHEGVAHGFAVEHAEIVCEVLAELLPEEPMGRLRRELGG